MTATSVSDRVLKLRRDGFAALRFNTVALCSTASSPQPTTSLAAVPLGQTHPLRSADSVSVVGKPWEMSSNANPVLRSATMDMVEPLGRMYKLTTFI